MAVRSKICGISDHAALDAVIDAGGDYFGLVFFPPSPRAISLSAARRLVEHAAGRLTAVGVFVDAQIEEISSSQAEVGFSIAQLHGNEPPEACAQIRERLGMQVIKAIPVAEPDDPAKAEPYYDSVDYILFDAKPVAHAMSPGGNAQSFDWLLLAQFDPPVPWFLSGGLSVDCLEDAVEATGARYVDVSSGVETTPGQKSIAKIQAFLDRVRTL